MVVVGVARARVPVGRVVRGQAREAVPGLMARTIASLKPGVVARHLVAIARSANVPFGRVTAKPVPTMRATKAGHDRPMRELARATATRHARRQSVRRGREPSASDLVMKSREAVIARHVPIRRGVPIRPGSATLLGEMPSVTTADPAAGSGSARKRAKGRIGRAVRVRQRPGRAARQRLNVLAKRKRSGSPTRAPCQRSQLQARPPRNPMDNFASPS